MRDPAARVLSGLLSCGVILIDEVSRNITEQHFQDPTYRDLYRLILTYRSVAEGVLNRDALGQMVAKLDAGSEAVLVETFDALASDPIDIPATRFAAQELRDERERWLFTTMLRDAQEIATGSVTEEPDRFGRPGRTWAGITDAREWVDLRSAEIRAEVAVADSPAADIFTEGRQVLLDYRKARDEDKSRRPLFGIPQLDAVTGGLGKGELVMVAAPSGFGKTQLCVSTAYHGAVEQGLHVYFATSETVRTTVRARLLARHSRNPEFEDMRNDLGAAEGLDSKAIDRGLLPREHERLLGAVVKSYMSLSKRSEGGSLWVAQMPFGQTMQGLTAQVEARARAAKPDLVIVDYLALMSSAKRHASKREELSAIIIDAAHMVVDFDRGEGIPMMSPWQLNRESQKDMVRTGELDQNGLAETAEAVNSADLVLALSPDGERTERKQPLKLNVLKNREGTVLIGSNGVPMLVDYATSYFDSRMAGSEVDAFDLGVNGGLDDASAAGLLGSLV